MAVAARDHEGPFEIERCNWREGPTLFWSDLVSCVWELYWYLYCAYGNIIPPNS